MSPAVRLISLFMSLSLAMVQARISNWRVEFVKCSYLNSCRNASRTVQFCRQPEQFFCCEQDRQSCFSSSGRCCSLDELLTELRLLFYLCKIVALLAQLLLVIIVLLCVYILIKTKKLLKHVYQRG